MDEGGDFKAHVVFYEEDVWKSAEGTPCMVELKVTDCHGNSNTCMVAVSYTHLTLPTICSV